MHKPTPLPVRLWRLARLAGWLLNSWRRVARLDRLPENRRSAELTGIARAMLDILNVQVHMQRPPGTHPQAPLLIVANHVSWLDILVLLATAPGGFIAKQSIRRWPVIGQMAVRTGTVFINRDARSDITPVNLAIAEALRQGRSVVFFPEARTSDGLDVLPFKAALFQAALDTGTPVQAVALRYHGADGRRCPEAAWVGDTLLRTSILRVLRQSRIDVYADFAPLHHPAPGDDRFTLKEAAETFVRDTVRRHPPNDATAAS